MPSGATATGAAATSPHIRADRLPTSTSIAEDGSTIPITGTVSGTATWTCVRDLPRPTSRRAERYGRISAAGTANVCSIPAAGRAVPAAQLTVPAGSIVPAGAGLLIVLAAVEELIVRVVVAAA